MTKTDIDAVVKVCIDMANRYDEDIYGCGIDELIRYGEGITCCFRLAYIFKYGKFPPAGDAWFSEFATYSKNIPRNDEARIEYTAVRDKAFEKPHNPFGYCGECGPA